MMNSKQEFIWQGITDNIMEHCELQQIENRLKVTGEISGTMNSRQVHFRYKLTIDDTWLVKELLAEDLYEENGFRVHVFQPSVGLWLNEKDEALSHFNNCIDIDIYPTPFTNSLPLKRDPLKIGESKAFRMMWIDLSEGIIKKEHQRYERLSEHTFRFTSIDTGFTEQIQFTGDLFVHYYPRLFQLKG